MRGHAYQNLIVALDENGERYSDTNVKHTIDQHDRESYISAAKFLNESNVDLVSLQHEFGIFGGEWGEYVLDLCRNIEMPLVTTFHTVLQKPPEKARQVVNEIAQISSNVVVTIESAAKLLEKHFAVDPHKIRVIRHGAALPDRVRKEYAKRQSWASQTHCPSHAWIDQFGKGDRIRNQSIALPGERKPSHTLLGDRRDAP